MILEMEEALANWQRSVQSHRKKYPHLNYYTSQQLLDLRQEFGKLKKNPNSKASTKLKQLLLSVTPQPDQSKITIALTNVMKQFATTDMTSVKPKEKKPIGTLSVTSQLNPANFNEQQRKIYNTLTKVEEYKVSVVLAAFSELGEDADEDALQDWCMENESKFKDDEDIVLPETTNTKEEEEEITEDNPLVLELIEEEYDTKTAIEAVKLAKGDLQIAREIAADLNLGREINITTNNVEENEW